MTKQNNQMYIHLVWSTAERQQALTAEVQAWAWPASRECAHVPDCAFGPAQSRRDFLT